MKENATFLDLVNNRPVTAYLTIRFFEEDDEGADDRPPLSYYWHPSKNNILSIEVWGDKVVYAGILGNIDCYAECIPEDQIPSVIIDWINKHENDT